MSKSAERLRQWSKWEGPRLQEGFEDKPVEKKFANWKQIVKYAGMKRGETGYLVVFNSTRRPDADVAELISRDELAETDASRQPGFRLYFKGPVRSENLNNVSFCIWESQQAARDASDRQAHVDARSIVDDIYDQFQLDKYHITRCPFRKPKIIPLLL